MKMDEQANSNIIIGCDHAAFKLKNKIISFLKKKNYSVHDVGTYSEESVDYPDYAVKLAECISKGEFERGILLCGSGIGMSIVANRFKKVRAALCNDIFSAKMSRLHNNSNVLVMGARLIGDILAFNIIETWLETSFEDGRHNNRIKIFDNLGQ